MVRRMKGKPGRPKSRDPRDHEIRARLTESEYYHFKQACVYLGQTPSTVLRAAMMKYADEVHAAYGKKYADEEE